MILILHSTNCRVYYQQNFILVNLYDIISFIYSCWVTIVKIGNQVYLGAQVP